MQISTSRLMSILDVPAEPDSREVSPAELPHYVITTVVELPDTHRVVAAYINEE